MQFKKMFNLFKRIPGCTYKRTSCSSQGNPVSRRLIVKAGLVLGVSRFVLPVQSVASADQDAGGVNTNRQDANVDPDLYNLMNLSLKHEYGAVVQYANHAGLISALLGDKYSRTIQSIIQDEVEHACILTRELKRFQVDPTLAVWPPKTGEAPEDMINMDIAAEEGAVELYARILSLDTDEELKLKIESMQEAEKKHKETFSNILEELSRRSGAR